LGNGAIKVIQWIILTNGIDWQVFRIRFEQPIAWELVMRFDLLVGDVKDEKFLEALYLVTREGVDKAARDDLFEKIQCVNRFVIGALLLSEPVVSAVKKEMRKLAEGIRIDEAEITAMIKDTVLRRDLIDGDEANVAMAKVVQLYKQAAQKDVPKPKPVPVQQRSARRRPLQKSFIGRGECYRWPEIIWHPVSSDNTLS
jgi:hypothetical protein